jgi:hypothetical protein
VANLSQLDDAQIEAKIADLERKTTIVKGVHDIGADIGNADNVAQLSKRATPRRDLF